MPPKKEAPAKAPAEETGADDEERELVEKELVITYLKSRLGRYQERGELLLVENVKLCEELEVQKVNLRDINEFLTNELKARSLAGAALEQRIEDLEVELEGLRESTAAEVERLHQEKAAQQERHEGMLVEMERKVKTSREFLEQKDTLELQHRQLLDTLAAERKAFDKQISDLERQHVQDKDHWKKETAARVRDTKERMQKLTENQLETLTKRTILENEQMDAEMRYQSRQVEELVDRNKEVLEENAGLRRKYDVLEQSEHELARRNMVYQKTIKTLLSKLMAQNTNRQGVEDLLAKLQKECSHLEGEASSFQQDLAASQTSCQQLQGALAESRRQQDERDRLHSDVARFLENCLSSIRLQEAAAAGPGPAADLPLAGVGPVRQQEILQHLLEQWQARPAPTAGSTGGGVGQLSGAGRTAAGGTAAGGLAQPQHRRAGFKSLAESTVHGAVITGSTAESLPAHLEHTSLAMRQRKLADAAVQTQPSVPESLSSASMLNQLLGDVRPWGNRTVPPNGKLAESFLRSGLGSVQPQGAKPGLSVMSSA